MKWISVEDRQLEFPCLIFWADGDMEAYTVNQAERTELCSEDFHDEVNPPTHWMPLPEPPTCKAKESK